MAELGGIEARPPRSGRARASPARAWRTRRASSRWRRKQRISFEVMPCRASASAMPASSPRITVSKAMPRVGVGLRIEEDLGMDDIVGRGAVEIGERRGRGNPPRCGARPRPDNRCRESPAGSRSCRRRAPPRRCRTGSRRRCACASANISSGSRLPSICMCSSALGRPAMKASRSVMRRRLAWGHVLFREKVRVPFLLEIEAVGVHHLGPGGDEVASRTSRPHRRPHRPPTRRAAARSSRRRGRCASPSTSASPVARSVPTKVSSLRVVDLLPRRAHVEQVDEEVVGQLARPVGEHAVLASRPGWRRARAGRRPARSSPAR